MKRNKRRPETFKALMRRFTALVLGMWLLVMGLLTYAVAKDFLFQLYHQAESYSRTGYGHSSSELDAGLEGIQENVLIQSMGFHIYHLKADKLFPFVQPHTPSGYGNRDWIWEKWDLMFGYEAAVVYYDRESDFLLSSGNYLTFSYSSSEHITEENPSGKAYGYIDLDAWKGCLAATERYITPFPGGDRSMDLLLKSIRMTGYFEGNEFIPLTMHFISAFSEITEPLSVWENPDPLADSPPESELVTITATNLYGLLADYEPLTVDDVSYDGIPELLETYVNDSLYYSQVKMDLWDAVFIHYGRNSYTANHEDIGTYSFAIAVRCWPMGYAAWRLIPTYLVSLAVAVFLILRYRWRIRRGLIIPLENAITGIEQWIRPDPWHEPYLLAARLTEAKESLSSANAKIQQLETALDYAKDAEENRRQLISNITHELKTPLAVIHSYAEGLQSDIPAEKKEKYLSVILEEAERMDAMVLQMLDLSRLEAGKVRLASDPVSLLRLTERILEKFALSIQEKALTVSFAAAEDFEFTADEARVTQVITNLLSNAVKYSGQEGKIRLWIYKDAGGARFHISNTAPPLSKEALEKVFDSFYRADPSRSEPGTGLGLAIVKRIVELHRGSCSVQNTTYQDRNYVQFCVRLPLS